jgi:hypothetical protein
MNEKRKIKSLLIIIIKLFDDFQELKKKLNFKYAQGKKEGIHAKVHKTRS